jgi:hypothetical protein
VGVDHQPLIGQQEACGGHEQGGGEGVERA